METKSFKTRKFYPPQDDLFSELDQLDLALENGDVVVVTSKIVAIHQGRCVPISQIPDKDQLVEQEADLIIKQSDSRWRITVKNNTFVSSAGIDESNADNHYVLMPSDPFAIAKEIYNFLLSKYSVINLGVVITDSTSHPMRYGATGISIAWWGFEPVAYFTGKPDLFNRPNKFTRINIADSLAGVGVFAMGELDEQTPIARIRNAPHIIFTDRDTRTELFIPPREDIYWPLLKPFFDK